MGRLLWHENQRKLVILGRVGIFHNHFQLGFRIEGQPHKQGGRLSLSKIGHLGKAASR